MHSITKGAMILAVAPYGAIVLWIALLPLNPVGSPSGLLVRETLTVVLAIAPAFALPLALWATCRPYELPLLGKLRP